MSLDDYLTEEEWNACFYAHSKGILKTEHFGQSMLLTIQALLKADYHFRGIDDKGGLKQKMDDGKNQKKLQFFFGNPENLDGFPWLENGRQFLKDHLPDWIESDQEWKKMMRDYWEKTGGQ